MKSAKKLPELCLGHKRVAQSNLVEQQVLESLYSNGTSLAHVGRMPGCSTDVPLERIPTVSYLEEALKVFRVLASDIKSRWGDKKNIWTSGEGEHVNAKLVCKTIESRCQRLLAGLKDFNIFHISSLGIVHLVAEAIVQELFVALLMHKNSGSTICEQVTSDRESIYAALKNTGFSDWYKLEKSKYTILLPLVFTTDTEVSHAKKMKSKIYTLQTRHKNREDAAIAELKSVLKEKVKIECLFRKLNATVQDDLDAMKEKEIQLAKTEAALRNEKQRNEKLQLELVKVIGVCGLIGATEIFKSFPFHPVLGTLSCPNIEKMNAKDQDTTKNSATHFVSIQRKRTKIGAMLKENCVPDPDFTNESTFHWKFQCEQCEAYKSTMSVLRTRLRTLNLNHQNISTVYPCLPACSKVSVATQTNADESVRLYKTSPHTHGAPVEDTEVLYQHTNEISKSSHLFSPHVNAKTAILPTQTLVYKHQEDECISPVTLRQQTRESSRIQSTGFVGENHHQYSQHAVSGKLVTGKTFSCKQFKENIHAKSLRVAYTPLAVKIRKYAAELSMKREANVNKVQKQSKMHPLQSCPSNPRQFGFEQKEPESLLLRQEIEQLKLRNKVLSFGIKRMQKSAPTN